MTTCYSQLASLSPRPTSLSTGCNAPRAGDALHPVPREVGLGDSEVNSQFAKPTSFGQLITCHGNFMHAMLVYMMVL